MRIGTPRESKEQEFRVGLTTASAATLVAAGHEVWVEAGAGAGIGQTDADYQRAGARIAADIATLFENCELIVKVKEPNAAERALLRPRHTLFTFLHLACDRPQVDDLLASGACCIAYETVTDAAGRLPLLAPMSEIAGRLAVQEAAGHFTKHRGGRGLLIGGATGVAAARVTVVGGGVVGSNAARIALGLGARVTVLDTRQARLDELSREFSVRFDGQLETLLSTPDTLARCAAESDLLVGAVLAPGGKAACLISADMVRSMQAGSIIADVAIDQGGCCENSRPTTHAAPTFVVDGIIHYCVANIPGAVPLTASLALNRVTLPFVRELADLEVGKALRGNPHLLAGLNVHAGKLTQPEVARDLNLPYCEPLAALES